MCNSALCLYLNLAPKEWHELKDCIHEAVQRHLDLSPRAPPVTHQTEAFEAVLDHILERKKDFFPEDQREENAEKLGEYVYNRIGTFRAKRHVEPTSDVDAAETDTPQDEHDEHEGDHHRSMVQSTPPVSPLPPASGGSRPRKRQRGIGNSRLVKVEDTSGEGDLLLKRKAKRSKPSNLPPPVGTPVIVLDFTPPSTPFEEKPNISMFEMAASIVATSHGSTTSATSVHKDDELSDFLSRCDPPLVHLHTHLMAYGYDMQNLKILAKREVSFIQLSIERVRSKSMAGMTNQNVRWADWDHLEFYVCMLGRGLR